MTRVDVFPIVQFKICNLDPFVETERFRTIPMEHDIGICTSDWKEY